MNCLMKRRRVPSGPGCTIDDVVTFGHAHPWGDSQSSSSAGGPLRRKEVFLDKNRNIVVGAGH
jgi:hypothetical protein